MGKTYARRGEGKDKPGKKGNGGKPQKPPREHVVKPVRHHGEPGVPDYTPHDEQVARRPMKPVEERVMTFGVQALFALLPDFSGQRYFTVPDENGIPAIFCLQMEAARIRDEETGVMDNKPYVGVYLEEASVGNILHALPACARDVCVPRGQAKKGLVKRPAGMDDKTFEIRVAVAEYLFNALERCKEAEIARAREEERARQEALENFRKQRELLAKEDLKALTLLAKEGKEGTFALHGDEGLLRVKISRDKRGYLSAQPIKVCGKHQAAGEIQKMIDKKIRLQLRFVLGEMSFLPETLRPFEAGLKAFAAQFRKELEKHGLLEVFTKAVRPVAPVVVNLRRRSDRAEKEARPPASIEAPGSQAIN